MLHDIYSKCFRLFLLFTHVKLAFTIKIENVTFAQITNMSNISCYTGGKRVLVRRHCHNLDVEIVYVTYTCVSKIESTMTERYATYARKSILHLCLKYFK